MNINIRSLSFKYIIVFLFLSFSIFLLLKYEKDNKIDEYLNNKSIQNYYYYNSIFNKYEKLSSVIFKTNINKNEIINIFKNATTKDIKEKNKIRQELFGKLKSTYTLLNEYNLRQLHFHLPNNESFLRFHRPAKFGDNLTNIRETVEYVNSYKKPISGFEEGRIFNGFRFVYPLFDKKNNHLGSVEISFSSLAFHQEYLKDFHLYSNFLILKELVDAKVFKGEKINYIPSSFKDFYFDKKIFNYINKIYPQGKYELSKETKEEILKNILKKKNISIYDKKNKKIKTFIPVLNPVTKKLSAVYVTIDDPYYIINKTKMYYGSLFLLIGLLAIIFIVLYINHNKKTKLNAVLEEADSGIGIINLEGRFLDVNQTYCNLLGYSYDQLLNMNCTDLAVDEFKENILKGIAQAAKGKSVSKLRKRCLNKKGKVVELEISLRLLPSKKELVVVTNSIDDKIQLEQLNKNLQHEIDSAVEDIRQKDMILYKQSKTAAMGEMIDAIAHQWKSPLGLIKLYAQHIEFLLDEEDLKSHKDELKQYSTRTALQVDHLSLTIDEFRSFFRPDKEPETVLLKDIIEASLKLMKDELIKNTISTQISGDTTATVKLVANEFKHVIINLVSNSKDAFNDNNIQNREIIFEIIEDPNTITLKVKDNGGGIPKDIIKNIFHLNFTTKEEGKGTGVGLYLTKQILDKSNIEIDVENHNNGAVFDLKFPKI